MYLEEIEEEINEYDYNRSEVEKKSTHDGPGIFTPFGRRSPADMVH